MMKKKALMFGAALCVLGIAAAAPAQAAVFDFSYVGVGVAGSGQFFGNEVGNTGVYDLTAVTGTANGFAILPGLSSFASADNELYYPATNSSPTGYETPPTYVDVYGISFNTTAPDTWNIGNYYGTVVADLNTNVGGTSNGLLVPVQLTVSAPEIGTWAMMLLGFAGLGFAGYRGSRKDAALTA